MTDDTTPTAYGPDNPHPLLPPADDDAPAPEIVSIRVYRLGPGNQRTLYPRLFRAEELTDWEQIREKWGGGRYELVGRNRLGQVKARAIEQLPGEALPMFEGMPDPQQQPEPAPPPPPPAPMQLPASGDPMSMMLAAAGGGGGSNSVMLVAMLQMMMQQAKDQAGKDAQRADQHVQAMGQMYQAQTQTMMAMLSAQRPSGSSSVDEFLKVLQIGQQMSSAQPQTNELEAFLDKHAESLMPLLTGLVSRAESEPSK